MRSFLGHVGFYQRFIKDFSKIAKPLTHLLVKDTPFAFNEDCLSVFISLKEALISAPIMQEPDWDLPFEIMCDASDLAVGVILGQRKEKKLYVIYYASRTLNEVQINYATTEKALLAVVFSIKKFRSYLVNSKVISSPITPPSNIFCQRRIHLRILLLQEFDLETRDKKGVENVVVDHLSHLPMEIYGPPINDSLPDEHLLSMTNEEEPWYADLVNYLAYGIVPNGFDYNQKKRFFAQVKYYF